MNLWGGGDVELSLRLILLLLRGLCGVFRWWVFIIWRSGVHIPLCSPPSLDSSSLEVPSAVHHVVRMSSRRLPVIFFVSLIEFMIMFMLCVARSAFGGRRRLLHCLRAIARLPLRLGHSHLCLLGVLSATLGCQISVIWCFLFMMPIQNHLYVFTSVSYHCVNYTTMTVDGFCPAYFHLGSKSF